jgi:hypothetical protein
MRPSPRAPRFAITVALLVAALALGGCMMNASGSQSEQADPAAPAADASGKPLVDQPLSNEAVTAPDAGQPGEVDYSCTTDADCAVKDVGSCCGYSPACVNVDSPTFPEQVKAECAKNDMQSTCGFRDIEGCTCVEGRCAAGPATSGEAVR